MTSPHPAWHVFAHPHRYIEARAALARDQAGVLAARGSDFQETALHWAALSDPSLIMDLVAAGAEPNALDRLGRTPLDWFNDLLWMSLVQSQGPITEQGKDRLRFKAARQIPVLWGQGFRPGPGAGRSSGEIWLRAGVYELISLLGQEGAAGLRDWGTDRASALHAWVLSDRASGRSEALVDLLKRGLDIDEADTLGRTPLRYVVEAWAGGHIHRRVGAETVALLLANKANPELADHSGIVPGQVPLLNLEIDPKTAEAIDRALSGVARR